jgi:hypothetical protein
MPEKCATCGKPSRLLCDGRTFTLSSGVVARFGTRYGSRIPEGTKSCDAPMCLECRTKVSDIHLRTNKGGRWDTIDLCPLCAAVKPENT